MWRRLGLLPRFVYPRMELRPGDTTPISITGKKSASYRVLRRAKRGRASDIPCFASHQTNGPRLSRGSRRAIGRLYDSDLGMEDRRHQQMADEHQSQGEGDEGLSV